MEECDKLCSRMGFLNKGTLVDVGSNQDLKSRFGTSFVLTLTVANPSEEVHSFLNEKIREEFGVTFTFFYVQIYVLCTILLFQDASPTNDVGVSRTYNWKIPRVGQQTEWSSMFKRVSDLCDRYPANDDPDMQNQSNRPLIMDFSLTQDSIKQIFLTLMKRTVSENGDN